MVSNQKTAPSITAHELRLLKWSAAALRKQKATLLQGLPLRQRASHGPVDDDIKCGSERLVRTKHQRSPNRFGAIDT